MKNYYGKQMTKEELEVLRIFMEQFRGQDAIVADQYTQQFNIIPFHDERISIPSGTASFTGIKFKRKISYGKEPYVVNFQLRNNNGGDNSRELKPIQVDITGNGITHYNRFVGNDLPQYDWLDEMVELFGEKEIKSPITEYGERMIVNSKLQEFIENHEWSKIAKGVAQMPVLANALFLESESCTKDVDSYEHSLIGERDFSASFGTILYHLITFKNNNIGMIGVKELKKLDALILKLSNSDLLKVEFTDFVEEESYLPPNFGSVLLNSQQFVNKAISSRQNNVANGELSSEERTLHMIKTRSR